MKIRLFILCFFLVLLGLIESAAAETEYFAVYLEGKKIGHAVSSREVVDYNVITTETVDMTISRFIIPVSAKTTEKCIETTRGRPLGFEVIEQTGLSPTKITGSVNPDGVVEIVTSSMGFKQKRTMQWPDGALMAEGLRLFQKRKGLRRGTKYKVKIFSPSMQKALDTQVYIGLTSKTDLLGRIVDLTEVITKTSFPGAGEIVSTTYVDEDFRVQKSITPMMGMQLEQVACSKDFALSGNDVLDLLSKAFLESPRPLKNIGSAKSVRYYLSPDANTKKLYIPSTNSQRVRQIRSGQVVVTVTPVAAKPGIEFPYRGKDVTVLEAVIPTRFLQSDKKEIVELAKKAIGDTKDTAEAVERIESFVAEYVKGKSLSVAYASAGEVAKNKEGDCSEHSVLAAAMCRAVGIPAQVVVGVAYVDDFEGMQGFGPHAWIQAYIGDKWVGFDPTFKSADRDGFDAGHIALAAGDGTPEAFFNTVFSLGQFKIDKVTVEE